MKKQMKVGFDFVLNLNLRNVNICRTDKNSPDSV